MPRKPVLPRRRRAPVLPLLAACRWLRAATALAVLSATSPVHARDILRSGMGRSASQAAAQAANAAAQQASAQAQAAQAAVQRSNDILRAKSRMREAQAAAAAGATRLRVVDGLGGGLQVVDNPALAGSGIADDGTNTWIGAALPTQTITGGRYDVTVDQSQSRAILSWKSFDVGANTSLTFDQHGNGDWIALNRVVGGEARPSQILGSMKADGTLLVINQNGILFGAGSQVNVRSLAATSLEIGRGTGNNNEALTLAQRNGEFLQYGLLGWADVSGNSVDRTATFASRYVQRGTSAVAGDLEGGIEVQAGASIASSGEGFLLLGAPAVTNAGHLSAPDGQVILAAPSSAGGYITLRRSDGSATGLDPDVRGLVAYVPSGGVGAGVGSVVNTGLIEVERGSIQLGGRTELGSQGGSVLNGGILSSSTSVSRNGAIELDGRNVTLAAGSIISITADDRGETIPQDGDSLASFKASRVTIGDYASTVAMEGGATIYVPGGDVTIGAGAGEKLQSASSAASIRVGDGAVIDVGGLKDVLVPASRNAVKISPVKGNELRDSPGYRGGFLAGATVYVDPRLSGVRDDGVAWIGSPLIEAGSYYQQVGVTAAELLTRGGNVVLGTSAPRSAEQTSRVVVEKGAVVDFSGGWVRYEAGLVRTTKLIAANGRVVDIGAVDPNVEYIGIHQGFTVAHPRWGKVETYSSPFVSESRFVGEYTEGRDAGTLTVKAPSAVLDGTLRGQAFAGMRQIADGVAGTGKPATYGDLRATQAAPSQLPAGGLLFVQALGMDASTGVQDSGVRGGGDIAVVASLDGAEGRTNTIALSDDALSGSGLSQVSLWTKGKVDVARDAAVSLQAGGVFDVLAGGTITVDGAVSAAGGRIQLETASFGATPSAPGALDVVVNGTLSVRGRWVNDLTAAAGAYGGPGWLDGGSITLVAAPSVLDRSGYADPPYAGAAVDVSGSILVHSGALLDLSGGGRVDPAGELALTGRGGNLSLVNQTAFFQTGTGGDSDYAPLAPGQLSGFRVHRLAQLGGSDGWQPARVAVNPDQVNAKVLFDPASIRAQGFAGGGTFTLVTPEATFGDAPAGSTATALPLDFFSSAGFGKYSITSYKTLLDDHRFLDASGASLGGKNAVLKTQTLTIGAGQTLNLTQSMLPSLLTQAQATALRDLASGGDLLSVLSQGVGIPAADWDRRPVDLTLGGALELKVEAGGKIVGAPGAVLTVSKLLNEGQIRLPGGTIHQQELRMAPAGTAGSTLGVHQLSDAFAGRLLGDGTVVFDEDAANALGVQGKGYSPTTHVLTNRELADQAFVYLLGELDADQGIVLAPGSVTDLSGVSVRNPRAAVAGEPFADGRVYAGGTIELAAAWTAKGSPFSHRAALGDISPAPSGVQPGLTLTVMGAEGGQAAAVLDLSGAADTYDQAAGSGRWAPAPVWSDAGRLSAPGGATLTGGDIRAFGGAPQAQGGVLEIQTPTLYQDGPAAPALDAVSARLFGGDPAAGGGGFDTLVALGSVTSKGDVTLKLDRAFVLASAPSPSGGAPLAPSVGSGGAMVIEAPYVAFASGLDVLSSAPAVAQGGNSAIFHAGTIDVFGAVLFDPSVARAELNATGDLRLTGVAPLSSSSSPSLRGHLAVGGDLSITAGRVYPTTGSSFAVTSSKPDGTISFHRPEGAADPAIPWSAGAALQVQAAHVVQGGALFVPLGTLALGATQPYAGPGGASAAPFAPATASVELLPGAVTSVAADKAIPYGTTTDGVEWYFEPTTTAPLSAPPAKELKITAGAVTLDPGTRIDVSGGGDVYAYEFSSGTGGSRDVLDRLNADPFSGNRGYQYPDGRQVYAIVPGLSGAPVAAYDPVYSSGYGSLYAGSAAGRRIYLDGAPGLAAGWYTLLPAKYATLPGGMRVVDMGNAKSVAAGTSAQDRDGSLLLTGTFGDALSGASASGRRLFEVMPQETIRSASTLILTSGNAYFAAKAAHDGALSPRLPVDAGRIVLSAADALTMTGAVFSAAAPQGRGSQVDIAGAAIAVVSALPAAPVDDRLYVLAGDLTGLGAGSLLVGGTRTDNADGTTTIVATAASLSVENDAAHPLQASEIVLAAGGSGSSLAVADGAALAATGTLADTRAGAYKISGAGSLVRIAAGPERLVTRDGTAAASSPALRVGRAALAGTSVMFDGSGTVSIAPDVSISGARYVALGADRVGLGVDPATYGGLVVSDALRSALAGQEGSRLTLRAQTAIDLTAGEHAFGNVRLDAPVLALYGAAGGAVSVTGDEVTLGNVGAAAVACTTCGGGTLAVSARELIFNSGTVVTSGLGGGIALTAREGVFAAGESGKLVSGKLDAGTAPVAVHTPYLGDRGEALPAGAVPAIPDLAIVTSGTLTVDTGGAAPLDPVALPGVPGAGLTLQGNGVTIAGTRLRATAGRLTVASAGDLTLTGGAVLEAPGYSKVFGDEAGSVAQAAPGGTLSLSAQGAGGIALGDATLSVGGGAGDAGRLELSAPNGRVDLGTARLDGRPGEGGKGGRFALDARSAIDLVALDAAVAAQGFTGGFEVHTREGNLTLSAGQTLRSGSVKLIADGGLVDVSGTIDTSGVNGGDVALFGTAGVALRETAVVDAHAEGYADTDTRQARAGDVTLGTEGTGALSIAAGARLDLSARRTTNRVVPVTGAGGSFYQYVEADQGGTLHLRAPVVDGAGGQTVAVTVGDAASVRGAREVVLEGVRRFELAAVAADPRFTGVTLSGGVAELDTSATAAGKVNFLADDAAGTLVAFVQDFDVSAAYGNLGGLASSAAFHARPGIELDHPGGITLKSSWNLGAGVVDVPAAVAAGAMAYDPAQGNKPYVLPGKEAEVFARFTSLVYRTDADRDGRGDVDGEPGILTLRAGGDLRIQGSVSDGFFQFRDQTDPSFLGLLLGRGSGVYDMNLQSGQTADGAVQFSFESLGQGSLLLSGGSVVAAAPYSAAANSPAAVSAGDAMGAGEVFPLLSGNRAADSWSYRMVAGAGGASSDPLDTSAAARAGVVVEGLRSYSYQAIAGTPSFSGSLLVGTAVEAIAPQSPADWLADYEASRSADGASTAAYLNFGNAYATTPAALRKAASDFFRDRPGATCEPSCNAGTTLLGVRASLDDVVAFLTSLDGTDSTTGKTRWSTATGTAYNSLLPKSLSGAQTNTYKTLVRTGTGRIDVAAAGGVDLTNGAVAGSTSGTSIYTAGRRADTSAREAIDVATGRSVTIDPSGHLTVRDAFAGGILGYTFGLGWTQSTKAYGVPLVANPLYLEGGGGVRIEAGGDVRGRFDRPSSLDTAGQVTVASTEFQGSNNEPWRVGAATGTAPDMRLNPQQFRDGLGTLAGGDIDVNAGGSVVDLTAVATGGAFTASARGTDAAGRAFTRDAWRSLGGGNVDLRAGADILGGHVDVVSGTASLSAGRDLASSGQYTSGSRKYDALLRVRLIDAEVSLAAGRQATIGGVVGLKLAAVASTNGSLVAIPSWVSPESELSLVANGSVRMRNEPAEDLGDPYHYAVSAAQEQFPIAASLRAASLTGDLDLGSARGRPIVLSPSRDGALILLAGGGISSAPIAMDDRDPTWLPIPFGSADSFRPLRFPAVFPDTAETERRLLHDEDVPHAGDPEPVQIHAGGDIRSMIVSVPKQARISAGRDIVDMMFFGQNLGTNDVTRIVAGRDITATSKLASPQIADGSANTSLPARKALQGNTFVIGGPGSFFLEAGRDMGPFLDSAETYGASRSGSGNKTLTFGGGILSVGNEWNPWLPEQGADLYVLFGLGSQGGPDYHALRSAYVDPAHLDQLDEHLRADLPQGYGPALARWLEERYAAELRDAFGTEAVTTAQAFAFFAGLPEASQRVFLLSRVYFNELRQAAVPASASYQRFSRGYQAVDTLFPAERGFTQNGLQGGAASEDIQHTGDLDLRLATIQTARGGDVRLLGPGGRVLAGSVVRTSTQAARLAYVGEGLFGGWLPSTPQPRDLTYYAATVTAIPSGYEGVLTLRGGVIETFTDGDFVLNQSRLFTQGGGSIVMWSSNGDLNAGQGPKTSANFPPVNVRVSPDAWYQVDAQGGVSGAGIAAFQPSPGVPPPDVYLLAPRGTVDAGDAGVRVAGNLSIVANFVANADNIQVGGQSFGVPTVAAPNLGAVDLASDTAGAAAAVAGDAARSSRQGQATPQDLPSILTVDVVGYEAPAEAAPADRSRDRKGAPAYNPNSAVQIKGSGDLTDEQSKDLTDEEKRKARKHGGAAE